MGFSEKSEIIERGKNLLVLRNKGKTSHNLTLEMSGFSKSFFSPNTSLPEGSDSNLLLTTKTAQACLRDFFISCDGATTEAAIHMPMYTPFVITVDSVPYHFDDITDFLQRKDTLPFSINTDVLRFRDICADATSEAVVKLEIDQPFSITINGARYVFENINDFISKYRDVFGVEIQPTLFVPKKETLTLLPVTDVNLTVVEDLTISCDGATNYADFAVLLRDGTDPSTTDLQIIIDGEILPPMAPQPDGLRTEEGELFPYDIPNGFSVQKPVRFINIGNQNRRMELKSLSDDIQVFAYSNPTSIQLSSDNSHAGVCLSEAPENPSSAVAFNNFLMTPIDDNTVRVTFTNPQANYNLSQYWIVYRSNTPFQGVPTQAQVWDNKSGIINGVNTYDVTGTPGSTYYLAFALTDTGNTGAVPINPIAYITVTIPEVVVQDPVQKVGLTLQLSSNGTDIGGVFTNPNNPLEFSYYRVWTRDIDPPMTSIDQATETWYTINSSPQWDMSNIFRNVEVGVPYSVAVALVGQDTHTPVNDITYATYTKKDILNFNIPSISLDPVDVRDFSSTVNTNYISAMRGGWFDTNGNLWGYGIKGSYDGPYLAEYTLNTPFDVGSVASQTHHVFDFNIGTRVENILTVNFINRGTVAIITANSPVSGMGRFMIARVCDTPYNLMSSVNNPNIECSELSTLMSTWNNPPISINPENNKLHSVTNNKNLNEVTLTYTPGVSTKIEVSGLKTKEMTSIIHHAIWDSNVTVTGVQIGTDGTRLLITQSNWGQPDKKSRILQFLTTTPFEFNSGVTLVDYSLDPFGSNRVDLFLSLNSPTYHPHSKFNNKPALLLISQEPIRIVQRGYTLT